MKVILTENSRQNLQSYFRFAAERAPETAARWISRFEAALETLEYFPRRCSIAPESRFVGREIRQFLFGKRPNVFRVLFEITGEEVLVLHIRRGSMDFATWDEIFPSGSDG